MNFEGTQNEASEKSFIIDYILIGEDTAAEAIPWTMRAIIVRECAKVKDKRKVNAQRSTHIYQQMLAIATREHYERTPRIAIAIIRRHH